MLARLLLLFLIVPLVELYLLIQFAERTSALTTIGLVVVTGVAGSILASKQGAAALRNFQSAIREGRFPGTEALDGVLIAFAAALLLAPGLLTDTLGILLLVPWSRSYIRAWLVQRYAGRVQFRSFTQYPPQSFEEDGFDSQTVDATFHRGNAGRAGDRRLPSE